MRLRVLGPVSIDDHVGGGARTVEGERNRAVLATLALHAGESVTTGQLVDAVWGEEPPRTAAKTLQGHVSELRDVFGDELITTTTDGYALGPSVDRVDAVELDRLVTAGISDLERGDHVGAGESFRAALSFWRGAPLEDLAPGRARDGQVARLQELRSLAGEGLLDAHLRSGRHREIVPDLERMVGEQPYRESLWRLLMLALHRSGRTADALRAYQRLRTTLVDDLGIEPSDESRDLERRILERDPRLEPPAPAVPTNLPRPLDTFVDRDEECERLLSLVESHQLVTLLGIGGVGKSRLANEVALRLLSRNAGGVWWVDLAQERDDDGVVGRAAAVVAGSDQSGTSAESRLLARLASDRTVLVLDNCEHVLRGAGDLATVITSGCRQVSIVATSRVPLGIPGEQRMVLDPLSTVPSVETDLSIAAELLVDRASARTSRETLGTADAEHIAALVAGLPLGLELAAAQCGVRSPDEIVAVLAARGDVEPLSEATSDPRHPDLTHVLDATSALLEPALASVLPLLAVLPGTFDLAAAAAVLDLPESEAARYIDGLLEVALVSGSSSHLGRRRFRLLWPVRQYLLARLDDDRRAGASERHARHFQRLARQSTDDFDTPSEPVALQRVRHELHHLLTAIEWFERHDPAGAVAFATPVGMTAIYHGEMRPARDLIRRLLDGAPEADSLSIAQAEELLSWLEAVTGDVGAGLRYAADAVARLEAQDDPGELSCALRVQAHLRFLVGEPREVTEPIFRRAIDLARSGGGDYRAAMAQVRLANVLSTTGETPDAELEVMLDEVEEVFRRCGSHDELADVAMCRAFARIAAGDVAGSRAAEEEMLRQSRLAGNTAWEGISLMMLGMTEFRHGNAPAGRARGREALLVLRRTGNLHMTGQALHVVAIMSAEHHPEASARLSGAARVRTTLLPIHVAMYQPYVDTVRAALGERFDELAAAGARMSTDDAVALALSVL